MSNFITFLDGLYDRLQSRRLHIFSFLCAIFFAAMIMWNPHTFAEKIGGFNFIKALGLIWATCTGMIHGLSFKPRFWFWQLVFFPPFAWGIFIIFFSLFLF